MARVLRMTRPLDESIPVPGIHGPTAPLVTRGMIYSACRANGLSDMVATQYAMRPETRAGNVDVTIDALTAFMAENMTPREMMAAA